MKVARSSTSPGIANDVMTFAMNDVVLHRCYGSIEDTGTGVGGALLRIERVAAHSPQIV